MTIRTSLTFVLALAPLCAAAPADAAMLTADVCRDLVRSEAAISPDYKPGVTARGGRVVPVEARPQAEIAPFPATVDVSVVLKDRFRIPAEPRLAKGEIPISRFIVQEDGGVTFAGQRLNSVEQQQISIVCRRIFGG